jgi:hypothetical protein
VYPDGTQKPPGDAAEGLAARRVPLVKVAMQPSVDLSLYSLAALRFAIPPAEGQSGRGFTVALYETRKFHKDRLIDSRTDATVADDAVRAEKATDAVKLSKGHTYTAILFGDPLPQTPGPYSAPQYPGTQMMYPQQPGQPYPQQGLPYPARPGFPTPSGYPTPYPPPPEE